MARKKVKLAWIVNETSRAISLKKRRSGLLKKVRELTILCDVRACMILFSPNEVEPMVWPSIETARGLLDDFFALPEIEKKKKEANLESYLKEKTKKVHDQMKKRQKKNTEDVVDQLMSQLQCGREIVDLNLNEISGLLSFSKDKILHCRKRLGFVEHPPLRDPLVHPFGTHFEEPRTNMNNVFVGGGQDVERFKNTGEVAKRIHIGKFARDDQSHYLFDQWIVAHSEPPKPIMHHQMEMEMGFYNENPNPRSYLPYRGSSSNGNPSLEMEPVGSQVMTFPGLVGSISQPFQDHNMNNNQMMAMMGQPRQYPVDFMSYELAIKEEQSNINNGNLQFHMSINSQEPPPTNETNEQGNVGVPSFDINMVWPGINDQHF